LKHSDAEAAMSREAAGHEPDWQKLRQEIRLLCYEAASALEEGRGLDKIRPRPLLDDLQPARDDLIRTLVDLDWESLPASGRGTIPTEKRLYELIYRVCRRGHTPNLAWGAILELIEAGAVEPLVRPRRPLRSIDPNASDKDVYLDLDAGDGCPFLRMVPERIEAYRRSIAPIEKPKWDRGARTLSYKGVVCRKYKKFAKTQFSILDRFQELDWPASIPLPGIMSRQTVQDLNDSLTPDCPIRFGYSDKTNLISWEPR
jgi:hypothetical protein